MELLQIIAPYIPGLVIAGALLFVFGLLVRLIGDTGPMKVTGNKTMGYGVMALLLALALWAILRVMEAWESGVLESIGT